MFKRQYNRAKIQYNKSEKKNRVKKIYSSFPATVFEQMFSRNFHCIYKHEMHCTNGIEKHFVLS